MTRYFLFFILLFGFANQIHSQELNPVQWDYLIEEENEVTILLFKASIDNGWYLYSQEVPEWGPIPTQFVFDSTFLDFVDTVGIEQSEHRLEVYDEMFGMDLIKYKDEVIFSFPLLATVEFETISGYLEFMCCDHQQCLAPKTIDFTFNLKNLNHE